LGEALIDFEAGADLWQVFFDGHSGTVLTCGRQEGEAYSGSSSLAIEYDIKKEGWAACSLVYPTPRDWSQGLGLAAYVRGGEAGERITFIAYGGDEPDALEHYEFRAETTQEAVDGWQRVDIAWSQFVEPPWQGDGTRTFDPKRSLGLAISFDPETSGWLKVDDISLLASAPAPEAEAPDEESPATQPAATEVVEPAEPQPNQPATEAAEEEAEATVAPADQEDDAEGSGGRGLCPGSASIALLGLGCVAWAQRGQKEQRE
jgi:hypothetical protein